MCGIVGIWNLDRRPCSPRQLAQSVTALRHRGPDDEGYLLVDTRRRKLAPGIGSDSASGARGTHIHEINNSDFDLALGHRRLSILDLSVDGHQPMSYGNDRFWIVYNGEIYNAGDLRSELVSLGYRFRSTSDTEVVLAAFIQWGPRCQPKLNGMWSFGIWDHGEQTLFLSRDRFGIKPLYYYLDGNTFAFASEPKALLAFDRIPRTLDPAAIAAEIVHSYGLESSEYSIFKGIKRLQPGYCLHVGGSGELWNNRWWCTLDHLSSERSSFDRQQQKLAELLQDACRVRMQGDVEVTAALSGGLDSAAVTSCMARSTRSLRSVFVGCHTGYPEDEREHARLSAERIGVDATYVEIDPRNIVHDIDSILWHVEEVAPTMATAWYVYKAMREAGLVVSLEGHGSDELFGGYWLHPIIAALDGSNTERFKQLIELARSLHVRPVELPSVPEILACKRDGGRLMVEGEQIVTRLEMDPIPVRRRWTQSAATRFLLARPHELCCADGESDQDIMVDRSYDAITRQLYHDFHYATQPTILRNFDRASMAHGVEVRSPFLDWRLVCFAFSMESDSKFGWVTSGETRVFHNKRVLRQVMSPVVDNKVVFERRKLGFSSPLVAWCRGPLREFIWDNVTSREFLESDVFDGPAIRDFVANGRSATHGHNTAEVTAWSFVIASRLMQLYRRHEVCAI